MRAAFRRSPVDLPGTPAATEVRDGWTVVLRYEEEDRHRGPWLVDLSHRRRWDFQDGKLAAHQPLGLRVPDAAGRVGIHGPLVINRMNRSQVAIWHLGPGRPPESAPDSGRTETTDGHCMLAFAGAGVPDVLELLTPLDLFEPNRPTPFLTQGPVLQVPCQVVTFAADLVVMTFARGYGETFARTALEAGALVGLAPAGEDVFDAVFPRVSG